MPDIPPVKLESADAITYPHTISPEEAPPETRAASFQVETGEGPLLIDAVMRLLQGKREVLLSQLAREARWKTEDLERVLKMFERREIVKLAYPASLIQSPKVTLEKALEDNILPPPAGEVMEEYAFSADEVPARVNIIHAVGDNRPFYSLQVQTFGPYTQLLLEELRDSVAAAIPIEAIDLSDVQQAQNLKHQFGKIAKQELAKRLPGFGKELVGSMAGQLLHNLYGLGELEILGADDNLEEIAINSAKSPVTVYHLKYGWMKTNLIMQNEEHIQNLSAQIGRKVGREITNLNPILDAHLLSGDRVNATLFPISSNGNTLTIRRFSRKPWTIINFIGEDKTMSTEMAAWVWLAMQYELSILIAGSTASGKTSALNALLAFIPAHQRIITIEDVRELNLPEHMRWNWVPLTTRNPNPEGTGEVSMLDLLVSSLRMRPDRLVMGEMRTQEEAETLFEAMHTGHSVYATIHADSARQVLRRLIEPPLNVPAVEVEAIDLIIVQYRDRKSNQRRVYEIAEIEGGTGTASVGTNEVFRWTAREDVWEKVAEPVRLIQKLNMHTGLSEREIKDEVEDRMMILEWLVRRKWGDISQVGKVMQVFYADPDKVKEAARQDMDPSLGLG
ncbi:MAG: type II/IV secretion system ATPase subunit [Candidatus Diapherotrites archaeon]|nr:type II/IV secretion system ATPase subunit [Candidatus Diapherotrites archaeon]MDZ4256577.1 type II/IV secretion system ATPase subunit [archaeon]